MAPLPPNNTSRLFVDYETAVGAHTMAVRYAGNNPEDACNDVGVFLTTLEDFLYARTITGVRASVAGDDISVPFANPIVGASYGTGVPNLREDAQFMSFTGRDLTGRRARVVVFGSKEFSNSTDFRTTILEDQTLLPVVAALQQSEGSFLTIAGNLPVWNLYANLGQSAYWQRRRR